MFIKATDEKEIASLCEALSHYKRIKILKVLLKCKRPIILSELTRRVGEKELVATISKHVAIMERNGVVETFKPGTNVFVGLKKDVVVYTRELDQKLKFEGYFEYTLPENRIKSKI